MLGSADLFNAITGRDVVLAEKVLRLLRIYTRQRESKKIKRKVTPVNCHILAVVLARHVKDLKVVHGKYLGIKWQVEGKSRQLYALDHSWLETPDGSIIETWPPGFVSHAPLIYPKGSNYSEFGYTSYQPQDDIEAKVMTSEIKRNIRNFDRRLKEALKNHKDS